MARLRDTRTGVVVNVDADTAERLGKAYVPAEQRGDQPQPKKAVAKKAADKPSKS